MLKSQFFFQKLQMFSSAAEVAPCTREEQEGVVEEGIFLQLGSALAVLALLLRFDVSVFSSRCVRHIFSLGSMEVSFPPRSFGIRLC